MSQFVKYPDFVVKEGEELRELLCKVCGEPIAGMAERIKGDPKLSRSGQMIVTKVERFVRFSNFTELKMICKDGSFHITAGCSKCLVQTLNTEQLIELMEADMNEQGVILPRTRLPERVVGVKLGGGIT